MVPVWNSNSPESPRTDVSEATLPDSAEASGRSEAAGTRITEGLPVRTIESGAVPAPRQLASTEPTKLPLPLAFQDIDPVASGLTEPQIEMLKSLRERFLDAVGGPAQNPWDPTYAERWRNAQPASDQELRLFFGADFAERVALDAAQAAYASSRANQ